MKLPPAAAGAPLVDLAPHALGLARVLLGEAFEEALRLAVAAEKVERFAPNPIRLEAEIVARQALDRQRLKEP